MFLRSVIIAVGLLVLGLCVFALPAGIASDKTGYYWPIVAGLYLPAIPFFIALYQTLKLLGLIDKNKAFSDEAVRTLKIIRNCAAVIAALFTAGMPYIYYAADRDDAPGVIAIGLVIIGASLAIAVFAAVLKKILQSALDIKSENDLTV